MKKSMPLIAAAFLLLAAAPAYPDASDSTEPVHDMVMTAADGKKTVRLSATPCVHAGTLALLKPEWRPQFRKASGIFNGKLFSGCWRYEEDGPYVIVVYEDGDQIRYQPSHFRPDRGV
jgi:hypothetical protein